jgi:hypothetical protein
MFQVIDARAQEKIGNVNLWHFALSCGFGAVETGNCRPYLVDAGAAPDSVVLNRDAC